MVVARFLSALLASGSWLLMGCPLTASDDYVVGGASNSGASAGGTGSGGAGSGGAGAGAAGGSGGASLECPPDMADCDLDPSNGCEASLTSPSTCGSCDRDCAGGVCAGDPPLCGPATLVTGVQHARSLAIDDTHVYWTDAVSHRIRRVSLDGGAPDDLTGTKFSPGGIAISVTHAYWTEASSNGSRVMRVMLDGSNVELLADFQNFAHDVVLDDTWVYYSAVGEGSIRRLPLGGGANEVVLGGQDSPVSLEIMGAQLYFSENWAGRIRRVGIDGSGLKTYGSTDKVPRGVTVHPSAVLWTVKDWNDSNAGQVVMAPIESGAPTVLADAQPRPHTATTDGTMVYFTCSADKIPGTGSVRMVPLGGGTVRVLSEGEYAPRDIVVHGDAVYYGTGDAIKKIVR